jgi:apolipoprotein N-acyltransferase
LARQNRVWLEVGIGIDDPRSPTNWAWLFAPQGELASSYEKHHMAPPERREHYASGTEYNVVTVNGQTYGLAICKDMHFAAFGREYGLRHAAVMLVPAWDFAYLDGWLEARTTVFRGIENGYSIVRASREGLLTASDPYGRILAEVPSSELPGRSLLAAVTVTGPVPTLFTRIGNLFGWICVAAAALFLALGRTLRRKSSPHASEGAAKPA